MIADISPTDAILSGWYTAGSDNNYTTKEFIDWICRARPRQLGRNVSPDKVRKRRAKNKAAKAMRRKQRRNQ